MSLTITAELLADLAERRSRPEETAIVLGPSGWECGVWTESRPTPMLTALTLEELLAYTGGEELDDEVTDALLAEKDYSIPNEGGESRLPGDDIDWAVITGSVERDDVPVVMGCENQPWQQAQWFNLGSAHQVLREDADELRETGRAFSLWLTEGGRWLVSLSTRYVAETDGQWVQCSPERAAELVYGAHSSLLAQDTDDLPLLARAARTARDLADLLAFDIPTGDPEQREARAWKEREAAIGHERTARAIGTLVREDLQRDVRAGRQGAATTVRMANSSNDSRTARDLGISRTSLLALLGA
ncbi:hypothetical protein [Streptomyces sp. AC555_RSS877]|uniref:hypothetical protein n=1 Tax=Streptomyces sp. AC555_RSS877 TaxID=2823688 RepID=UPI001C25F6A6|nr:hypothetical protein [Streptomyces sp. AC555_RSS877]